MIELIISLLAATVIFGRFRTLPLKYYGMLAGIITFCTLYFIKQGVWNDFLNITVLFFALDLLTALVGVVLLLEQSQGALQALLFILQHKFIYCVPAFNNEMISKRKKIIEQIKNNTYQIVD